MKSVQCAVRNVKCGICTSRCELKNVNIKIKTTSMMTTTTKKYKETAKRFETYLFLFKKKTFSPKNDCHLWDFLELVYYPFLHTLRCLVVSKKRDFLL